MSGSGGGRPACFRARGALPFPAGGPVRRSSAVSAAALRAAASWAARLVFFFFPLFSLARSGSSEGFGVVLCLVAAKGRRLGSGRRHTALRLQNRFTGGERAKGEPTPSVPGGARSFCWVGRGGFLRKPLARLSVKSRPCVWRRGGATSAVFLRRCRGRACARIDFARPFPDRRGSGLAVPASSKTGGAPPSFVRAKARSYLVGQLAVACFRSRRGLRISRAWRHHSAAPRFSFFPAPGVRTMLRRGVSGSSHCRGGTFAGVRHAVVVLRIVVTSGRAMARRSSL